MRYAPELGPDPSHFPDPEQACQQPNGLLAVGGDLSPQRLMQAYRRGIFPWYSAGHPILWWSPDPRLVLAPAELNVSRSLRKRVRSCGWQISVDHAFLGVIHHCGQTPRAGQDGTWIVPEMSAAYARLHRMGVAHSVEVWEDGVLIGGLYGLALGRVFFGESMFSHRADASKVALWGLCTVLQRWGWGLIDCQVETPHLVSLGARLSARREFLVYVDHHANLPDDWQRADTPTKPVDARSFLLND